MIARTKFNGNIDGKELQDYKSRIDWTDKNFDNRMEKINKILNLNDEGISEDTFWQDVWDCGICKTNIGKEEARWEETDVAKFLEVMGSYLLYGYDKKEKKKCKETMLNEALSYDDIENDSNYRLSPPDKILNSDYKIKELFKGSYEDYVNKVKETPYEIKSRESWEIIKHHEEEKIKMLKEAKVNLDILRNQMERMKKGECLQFNKIKKIKRNTIKADIDLNKQLERYGLDNSQISNIEKQIKFNFENASEEEKKKQFRRTNVTLKHLQDNLSDVKDYMMSCKLAHTNRVMIKPNKCSTVKHVLELIDYFDPSHIRGMLMLGERKLDPSSDMAIVAFDINNKIKEMYSMGELSDRDMYIIEGIRYNVSHETLGKELGVTADAISKTINRICDNIVKSFYNDHMDLYFLNNSKGKYRICTKCGNVKRISQFNKNGDRLRSNCKDCR